MLIRFIESILSAASTIDARNRFIEAGNHHGFQLIQYRANFSTDIPVATLREAPVLLGNLPRRLARAIQMTELSDWPDRSSGAISASALAHEVNRPALFDGLAAEGLGVLQIVSLRGQVMNSGGAVLLWPGPGTDEARLQSLWAEHGPAMRLLSAAMHMRIATLARTDPARNLTPRQREVLLWRSLGKTVAEISTILGITVATVEKHLRLARENLGVETTPQAVLKAHVTQQLFNGAISVGKVSPFSRPG